MADLLSREGHPLAWRVVAARESRATEKDEPRESDSRALARRTLGMAAGAMLVFGTVAGSVLGLNHDGSAPSPSASAGEPVGALPGKSSPGQPGITPAVDGDSTAPKFTNAAAAESLPGTDTLRPAGEIGAPASLKPPKVEPPRAVPPGDAPAPPAARKGAPVQPPPAAQQQQPGPVQQVTAPVTNTVEQVPAVGQTLSDVVTPVTETVDDTLQPALSLIGGLLGSR